MLTSHLEQQITFCSLSGALRRRGVTSTSGRHIGSRLVMRRRCAFSSEIAQTASCKGVSTALNALSFDLDIPEIDCDLRTAQEDQGAIFEVC